MALAFVLALPLAAQASTGYTSIRLGLYAGPATGYPYLATIPAGMAVTVVGCTRDRAWCDVFADGYRGWMAGPYLERPYDGAWVSIGFYGQRIGIPVLRFDLDRYWSHHYRRHAFYRERHEWRERHFDRHPPRYRFAARARYGRYDHDHRHPPHFSHEGKRHRAAGGYRFRDEHAHDGRQYPHRTHVRENRRHADERTRQPHHMASRHPGKPHAKPMASGKDRHGDRAARKQGNKAHDRHDMHQRKHDKRADDGNS
jgi:uncharacterized protein YraI